MANYGRDPDTDAMALIQDCIDAQEQAAVELDTRAADLMADANRRILQAIDLRRANEKLSAQLALLKVEEAA